MFLRLKSLNIYLVNHKDWPTIFSSFDPAPRSTDDAAAQKRYIFSLFAVPGNIRDILLLPRPSALTLGCNGCCRTDQTFSWIYFLTKSYSFITTFSFSVLVRLSSEDPVVNSRAVISREIGSIKGLRGPTLISILFQPELRPSYAYMYLCHLEL